MVNTKAGCFIGRLDCLRLPLMALSHGGICATHRDEDRDVAQHGQLTKNIADLFLSSARRIPRCLEVVEQDKAGLFRGIEFRNDLFERNLLISRYLQLDVQDFEEESRRRRFNTRHPDTGFHPETVP
jgi:hypothetical protein